MFDRKLLSKLSQCIWKVLSVCLKHAVSDEDADPGAVITIQFFGDFLGFHPHAHGLVTDGCFYGEGAFRVNPTPNPKDLEDLFRYEVFKILKHLNLWDVKRKPPPRANNPPTESFIIYDESSSLCADDYITPLEAGLKPTFKKIQPQAYW